ncbi:hypothetical protein YC2023_002222 [Brassica napus]
MCNSRSLISDFCFRFPAVVFYCFGRTCVLQFNTVMEVEPPSLIRYLIGSAVMMIGVVLPVGYMMFRNKRVPSSSSYSKQTNKVLI